MRVIFLAASVALAGGLSACTEPGETTAISTATGGAIGAGLGAIIGSQTGDAGAGLVIGAAAGAGTGALVGNALEGQEQQIRTQDEAITRQERTIAAQRRELDELRRMNDGRSDTGTSRGYPSGNVVGRSNHSFRSTTQNPVAFSKPPPKQQPAFSSPRTTASATSSSASRAQAASNNTTGTYAAGRSDESRGTLDWSTTKNSAQREGSTAALGERDLMRDAPAVVESAPEESAPGGLDALELDSEAAGTLGTTPTNTARVATAECRDAENEVKKANAAHDAPDKLFHYRRALRLCPTNPAYHNAIGEVYLSLNRQVDAEFEFREALQVDPSFEPAQRNLDALSGASGQSERY
ncbi:MAG: glycine zipper domain-containing protein [Bdellovibrionota bacterium]|nr:MAG: glycine zipper domain-containing protein [Bdellovibrionota bacterium]